MSLTDHFGATPSEVCASILTQLSIFLMIDGSGCVRTIKRVPPDMLDAEGIEKFIAAGLPAFLIAHQGGAFEGESTSRRSHRQRCTVSILCLAPGSRTMSDRFVGDTPTVIPGIDDMLDWAYYYGLAGLYECKRSGKRMLLSPSPLETTWVSAEPGFYAARVDFTYLRPMDCWEDDPTATLQTLGICHDPTDIDGDWFDEDNETPLSDWPRTVDGGVTDLT